MIDKGCAALVSIRTKSVRGFVFDIQGDCGALSAVRAPLQMMSPRTELETPVVSLTDLVSSCRRLVKAPSVRLLAGR